MRPFRDVDHGHDVGAVDRPGIGLAMVVPFRVYRYLLVHRRTGIDKTYEMPKSCIGYRKPEGYLMPRENWQESR